MIQIRALYFAALLCLCTMQITVPDAKILNSFVINKILSSKAIQDKEQAVQVDQQKDIYHKNTYNCVIKAFQKKVSELQKKVDEVQDTFMEYIYALLVYHEFAQLTTDGDSEALDLDQVMIYYSKKDKKSRKERKSEAKSRRSNDNSDDTSKHDTATSSSSATTTDTSLTIEKIDTSVKNDFVVQDVVVKQEIEKKDSEAIREFYIIRDEQAIIIVTPDPEGDFIIKEKNPELKNDSPRFTVEKPKGSRALKEQNKFSHERSESINNTRQKCIDTDFANRNRKVDADFLNGKIDRQEAIKQVQDIEKDKTELNAILQERTDRKAATRQVKQDNNAAKKQRNQEKKNALAPDRNVLERAGDFFLCRTPRKKDVPSQPSVAESDNQNNQDQNTTDQAEPPVDNSNDNQNYSVDETPPTSSCNNEQDNQNVSEEKNQNIPEPVQSYADYLWSWIPSFHRSNDFEPDDRSSDRDDSNNNDQDVYNKFQIPRTMAVQIQDQIMDESLRYLTQYEIDRIDFLVGSLEKAQNDITVELAQAALQAFKDSTTAESDADRDRYEEKCKKIYEILASDEPQLFIDQQARSIKKEDIDRLLQEYTLSVEGHVSNPELDNVFNDLHVQRLKRRQETLIESNEQIRLNKYQDRTYDVSTDVRGFMMANQLNYTAFDSMKGTSFQHCLLQENLKIVEYSVGMAARNPYDYMLKNFAKQTCNLAISAQQLNKLSDIKQACVITDLNHFYVACGRCIYDEEYRIQVLKNTGAGVCQGADKVLQKWSEFAQNMWNEPGQTIEKMVDNMAALGNGLLNACSVAQDFSLSMYVSDTLCDVYDVIVTGKVHEKSRAQLRCEHNLEVINQGLSYVITTGHAAINNMRNKSLKDNVSDLTEFSLDSLIQMKITQSISTLSRAIGNELVLAAREMKDALPSHMFGKSAKFVADEAGQMIAVVDGTGEQIAMTMKASGKEFSIRPKGGMQKPGTPAKVGKQAGIQASLKPIKGSAEWKKAYPHGEFKPSAKHHQNSIGTISKPPVDGQAALNQSYGVKDSKQRIAIEGDTFVVLKQTSPDQYHGYIVNWKEVPQKLKNTLQQNKIVNESGKFLKK